MQNFKNCNVINFNLLNLFVIYKILFYSHMTNLFS